MRLNLNEVRNNVEEKCWELGVIQAKGTAILGRYKTRELALSALNCLVEALINDDVKLIDIP